MKSLFNPFRHFGRYFLVNSRFYIIYHLFLSAGLILVLAGYSFLLSYAQPQVAREFLNGSYWVLLNICGIILTTSAFSIFHRRNSGSFLLVLPVSQLTRLLTVFLYAVPLLFITITLVYTLVANGISWLFTNLYLVKEFSFNPFHISASAGSNGTWHHLLMFLLIQSVALMAGSFFTKFGFIKNVLLVICFVLIYTLITHVLSSNSPGRDFIPHFIRVITSDSTVNRSLWKIMPAVSFVWHSILMLLIPVTWYITYLRLKEIEV